MSHKPLFSVCPEGEFFGRAGEIEYIVKRASDEHRSAPGILLLARRWMGKTEVLRRVHSALFWGQSRMLPVYYQFKPFASAGDFAEDFLKEVLKQYIAFRSRDGSVAGVEMPLDKLERMLVEDDAAGAGDVVAFHREAKKSSDHVAVVRNAIASPAHISRMSGIPIYLMLDDLGEACAINFHRAGFVAEILGAASTAPFIAASSSAKVLESAAVSGSVEALNLPGLDEDLSVAMMMELCRSFNLEFDTEILALAATRLEGNPMHIKNFIWAACRSQKELTSLKSLAELYTEEITEGNIGFILRSSIRLKGMAELKALKACADDTRCVAEEDLAERLRIGADEVARIISGLSTAGLVEANLGSVKWTGDSLTRDFINYTYETRVRGRSGDEVRTALAAQCLKDGFTRSGLKVKGRLKEETVELVRSFNSQKVLKVLFRNQAFTSRYKNGSYKLAEGKAEDELTLPQVIGCFDSQRWEKGEAGPPILLANGFQNNRYDAGNEVLWIIGVKENFAPVNLGDVENYLRRSALLKQNFRTIRFVRWMIGKEGFTGEAQKRLEAESVYSTDYVQFGVLKQGLEPRAANAAPAPEKKLFPNKEFEVVLPASAKAELVAAKAVEEVGTEMGFDDKAISQIKTALVEACINAFEHSGGRATRVFLKFIAASDRLTINVQNGGVDFDSPAAGATAPLQDAMPRKRGWGIELMKGLMDEVRFERIRGGAKIVLVKYLIKKGDLKDEEA